MMMDEGYRAYIHGGILTKNFKKVEHVLKFMLTCAEAHIFFSIVQPLLINFRFDFDISIFYFWVI